MFTPLALGTNHMFGVDSYVPLTVNNFEIRIYNLDGSNPTGTSDLLTLSTSEIGEISEEQDIITVHYGNGLIKFPSKVSYGDVTWTLNCFCSPNVLGALRDWRTLVFDPVTERMGLPSEYMKQAYFIRYDGQGNARDVLRSPGIWISGMNYGGMNQEGGSLVQVSVTLVLSKLIPLTEEEIRA
ncbi:MAG: hypothetical protein NC548_45675 [Lachnospiraceae bacterium]|nr:hypothetical protein [Lachnospiraceae bacterium]